MKQEAKGKIFVGMIISVLAFGFATGTGIFIGANPLDSVGILNLTKQSEFPTLTSDVSNKGTTNSNYNNTQKEQTYVEPDTTPTKTDNSSSTPTQTNTSTTNSSD
jgi:hypothetical protein